MSSYVHIDNKGKELLILGERPTQGLDDITLTAEAIYPINFTQPNKRFVLSLDYNGSNSFFFVNATKTYLFKANKSERKDYSLCLDNISKAFTINNMNNILDTNIRYKLDTNTNNILDIHKYFMKET